MNSTTIKYERIERPTTREAISELVLGSEHVEISGAQTHGRLIPNGKNVVLADLSAYRGITEYEPQEYVISAKAGTPIREISSELAKHNQYLPFDPPDMRPETTLGGVVATGWSGPGSLRYGRLRDFILGVELVPGTGRWIKTGGKVVKNAAGFDIPKLVVGSLGCFGILGNITLKVFPSPVASMTISGDFNDFDSSLESLGRILGSGMTLDGCALESSGRLTIRLGGLDASLPKRVDKIHNLMRAKTAIMEGFEEQQIWQSFRNTGPDFGSAGRCKVPIRPSEIPDWQAFLTDQPYRFFYDQAGSVLIIDLDAEMEPGELGEYLARTGRSALCVGLAGGPKWLGSLPDMLFLNRIRKGLDPQGKFPDLNERFAT